MIINLEFLILDYIIIFLTVIFIMFAFWKGFINSILSLLTWVGSVFITVFTYEFLSNYLSKLLLNISFFSEFVQIVSVLSILVSIPLIFLLSLFILKRIRKILSSDLDKQIFGIILDKFFGSLYGIAFSYIMFSAILYFTNNNNFEIISNFNIFLIDNSNILKQISEYNENIIGFYTKTAD